MKAIMFVLALVQFTGPTGQRIDVNPAEVSSIRDPAGMREGHWTKGTNCIIVTADGGFIAVKEDCTATRQKLKSDASSAPCIYVCGQTQPR